MSYKTSSWEKRDIICDQVHNKFCQGRIEMVQYDAALVVTIIITWEGGDVNEKLYQKLGF